MARLYSHMMKAPDDLVDKWVRLYVEDGLNVNAIKQRFPDWSVIKIRNAIRERLGSLQQRKRSLDEGWC